MNENDNRCESKKRERRGRKITVGERERETVFTGP